MTTPFICITSDFGYIGGICWFNNNTPSSGYKYGGISFSKDGWYSDLLMIIHPTVLRGLGVPLN